jgi:hypothetical protein
MKIRQLIGFFIIFIFTGYFVAAVLAGSKSQIVTENVTIEKAIMGEAVQHSLKSDDQFMQDRSIFSIMQDRSIFSKTTVISLIAAVIGIVAFRRNTYT